MLKGLIVYTDFCNWQFDIAKARGSYIWDSKGRKLLDFTSGWNVVNLGWNHPEISKAVVRQVNKNTYAPMWTADPIQNKYADLLVKSLPSGLNAIGRVTGGMEANEEAIKLARSYTGRKKVLGFIMSYHGQSIHCLSLGYLPEWRKKITNDLKDLVQIPFPDTYRNDKSPKELLADLENSLEEILSREDIAAVLTESGTITGWGSTAVAPEGFITIVREISRKYGTLLILDEVGSGFSRLGKLFAMEIENAIPDIITLAKGISNGVVPIGAMVTTEEIAKKGYSAANLQSTFGWIPLSCAAALKTLQIHLRDKVWEKAEEDGNYLRKTIQEELKDHSNVGTVRGRGMIVGVDLVKDKDTKEKNKQKVEKVVDLARKKGLHLVSDHESNIQLMPPLTIKRKDLDKGIEILIDSINTSS